MGTGDYHDTGPHCTAAALDRRVESRRGSLSRAAHPLRAIAGRGRNIRRPQCTARVSSYGDTLFRRRR